MLYRKKPIIVTANQWFPTVQETGKPRKPEMHGVRYCPPNRVDLTASRGIIIDRPSQYVVDTIEGPASIRPGDWVVTGVIGEKYVVKPDIFELSYAPASIAEKLTNKVGWLFNRWARWA